MADEGNDTLYGGEGDADTDFINAVFDRPEMGDLLTTMLETWRSIGGGQLEIFQDVGGNDGHGRWGLRDHQLDDDTTMLDAITDFSLNNGMWWGDERDPTVFEDAFVFVSQEGQTSMVGGSRDDLFLVRDASITSVDGGDGFDTIILTGAASDYSYSETTITVDDTSIVLSNIERIVFEDTSINLI